MLGQALDKQAYILDVTRNHRLRDSPTEIYQFHMHDRTKPLPTGVFTCATPCFSYACNNGGISAACYAYSCPNRKQGTRQQVPVQQPVNTDILRAETITQRRGTTWTQSVPFSVFESLTSNEIKRQETIFEFIQVWNAISHESRESLTMFRILTHYLNSLLVLLRQEAHSMDSLDRRIFWMFGFLYNYLIRVSIPKLLWKSMLTTARYSQRKSKRNSPSQGTLLLTELDKKWSRSMDPLHCLCFMQNMQINMFVVKRVLPIRFSLKNIYQHKDSMEIQASNGLMYSYRL